MYTKSSELNLSSFSPLSVLEELLFQFDWEYTYTSETELTATVEGRWCSYRLFAAWREEVESIVVTAFIDIKIPETKQHDIESLLSAINPRIWLGHFEVEAEEELVVFRYTLTLRGNSTPTIEQMEEIIGAASTECDRLYPALQFVLWGGKTPKEALAAAMMETHGEA